MEQKIFKLNDTTTTRSKNVLFTTTAEKQLTFRIEQEEYSSWIYLAMSLWLENKGYVNLASLYKTYSDEEKKHANWAREYFLAMGVTPPTPALKQPKNDFSSLLEILNSTYDHENLITKQCSDLCNEANKVGDYLLFQLGQKYMSEQIEEIEKARTNLDKYEIAEKSNSLYLFDLSFKD